MTETNTLISVACPASGPPADVDTAGITSAATASTSETAMVRTGAASKVIRPWPRPRLTALSTVARRPRSASCAMG